MTARSVATRPKKPHPDFRLFPHRVGQWAKKVRGKVHYFGAWDDADAALRRWLERKDSILAGVPLRDEKEAGTVGWLVNTFLDAKEQQRQNGDLTQRSFDDYFRVCQYLANFFGKRRPLASLGPADFKMLRADFPSTWSPLTVNGEIARISAVIKFAFDVDAIDRRINTGPSFKRVSKKRQRLHRASQHAKEFTAAEIHGLINASPPQLRAMIFLGLNAGYGPADCGTLRTEQLDLKSGWLRAVRGKTCVDRAAWLWPETVQALRDAADARPKCDSHTELVFLTTHRRPWYIDGSTSNPVQIAFKKAAKAANCDRKGVGFYALRHTLETQGGEAKDQVAVDFIMGHADSSMAAEYREGISDQRIRDVCNHVRGWWLAGKPEDPKRGRGQ